MSNINKTNIIYCLANEYFKSKTSIQNFSINISTEKDKEKEKEKQKEKTNEKENNIQYALMMQNIKILPMPLYINLKRLQNQSCNVFYYANSYENLFDEKYVSVFILYHKLNNNIYVGNNEIFGNILLYYDLGLLCNDYMIISLENDFYIGDINNCNKSIIEIKTLTKLLIEKCVTYINNEKNEKKNINPQYKLNYFQNEFIKKNYLKISNDLLKFSIKINTHL